MDFKQVMGMFLLLIMCICAYGLFGVGTIEKHTVQVDVPKANLSDTPEISAYQTYTIEERVTVDGGALGIMLVLVLITSIGTLPKPKIYPEKGSQEEHSGRKRKI